MVKRMYFFKSDSCFEYDPRPGTDRVVKTKKIAARFKGLDAEFAKGIDAAVNWGDGFVFLFRGGACWKYDALADRVATPAPTTIAAQWPTFPASFTTGIDAAFNSGTGRAYLFKGDQYLRYDIAGNRVDTPDPGTSPYPRGIGDPNGWRGLPSTFESGLGAAVFGGNGKIYFFKDSQYVRLTFATRSVDIVQPPYPLPINPIWNGLPTTLDAGVEWIQAGTAKLNVTLNTTRQHNVDPNTGFASLGRAFIMAAAFATDGHPSLCGCAEYRQFVRGTLSRNGRPQPHLLPDPAGGQPVLLLPIAGLPPQNFQEDGSGDPVRFYGHRNDPPDRQGRYHNGNRDKPDQRSGCRYFGIDSPIMNGVPGELVDIDLEFRGVIIDVAADHEIIAERFWAVRCLGVL
jgi:hypothetical protein